MDGYDGDNFETSFFYVLFYGRADIYLDLYSSEVEAAELINTEINE